MMIQANELRLGNHVIWMGRETTITWISETEIGIVEHNQEGASWPQLLESISPIPLTEEWLSKLGFKLSGSWYEIRSDSVELSIYLPEKKASMCEFDKEQDSIYFPITNNSVHWLQNWYYIITGQELQLTT